LALPPACVGENHLVPDELTLFPGVDAPSAGEMTPLCNLKQVVLAEGRNSAVDFFMFTEVPISGHAVGFILDDLSNEFDPDSPQFGEKFAPPWLPVSLRDWTGKEISRTYSDEWGHYNLLVPSTYTVNIAAPSGMSPNMLTLCMNDPGPIPNPASPEDLITDPFFNPQYSQFCYTFQYMPGTTTYLDTPVLPVAAFAGPDEFPLDCNFPNETPVIFAASGPGMSGPYIESAPGMLTIVSMGSIEVPNPEYDGAGGVNPKTIIRDYGFGSDTGSVTVGDVDLSVLQWTANGRIIQATIPGGTPTGQLTVTRGDNGRSTIVGVTVTVGGPAPITVPPGGSIQAAIDSADPGDLIMVTPGRYEELVVMWKPVRLQGWGARSTTINAVNEPSEKLLAWRQKIEQLVTDGDVDLLPAQELLFGGLEPDVLFTEEGPGIIVLAKDAPPAEGGFGDDPNARIDGFTVQGASVGGGIFVNGYAHHLEISNSRVMSNQGFFGGGIRVGHPFLKLETPDGLEYQNGHNDNINIHNNYITQNGGLGGVGGGLSICTGADSYMVSQNFVCGNFTMGDGAGIGHLGLSDGGVMSDNTVIFNQSFNQGLSVSGGGIFVGGGAPLGGPDSLSPGAGSVLLVSNLIQGNMAGAGDGGGVRISRVNGQDVADSPDSSAGWHQLWMVNNMIVNNVAGLAGGAISMQDAARGFIINNTVANNDSTATAAEAFPPGASNLSDPQPAGIVSRAHSAELAAAFGAGLEQEFSAPLFVNNIVWHNRSFHFFIDDTQDPPFGLLPDVGAGDPPVYSDLAVLGTGAPASLNPFFSILTDTAGLHPSNMEDDPLFVTEYVNGSRSGLILPEPLTIIVAPAFDEGGNFIDVRFGPLTLIDPATQQLFGDYHIQSGSPAVNAGFGGPGIPAILRTDFDGQVRPNGGVVDIGADEFYPAP